MNTVRYYVALILVIILPPVLYFWLLIHPFVRFWRRLGPGWTYGIVCSFLALGIVSLFRIRQSLLAVEFGTNYFLTALGLLLLAASTWLGFQILHHMSILTILGLPELAPDKCPQQLITIGIYATIRHPRVRPDLPGLFGERPHCQLPGFVPDSGSLVARYLCHRVAGRKRTAGPFWRSL